MEAVVKSEYTSLSGGARFSAGERVVVDWARSRHCWVWCASVEGSFTVRAGLVPAELVQCAWTEPDLTSDCETGVVKFVDSLFPPLAGCSSSGAANPHPSPPSAAAGHFSITDMFTMREVLNRTPPILEPGLASIVWPVPPDTFLRSFWCFKLFLSLFLTSSLRFLFSRWKQKALCVLAAPDRLEQIRKDFMDFDVDRLIKTAINCVVWMKTTDGEMQHFDASAPGNEIARTCYLSGHSLYFNPPHEVQRDYIRTLCEDLGLNFGLEKEDGYGGDVEVFACRGRHVTDWHFDAQENFTVQLKGCKRWHVAKGIRSPVTNCITPNNRAQTTYKDQKKCHTSYSQSPVPPVGLESDAESFTLRPGSVLYVPAGWWHKVESVSAEGSLSINFSICTTTWQEFVLNHLSQLMWKQPHWRDNVRVESPQAARRHLAALLAGLQTEISRDLSAEAMLPEALFLENREETVQVTASAQYADVAVHPSLELRRNALAGKEEELWHSALKDAHLRWTKEGGASSFPAVAGTRKRERGEGASTPQEDMSGKRGKYASSAETRTSSMSTSAASATAVGGSSLPTKTKEDCVATIEIGFGNAALRPHHRVELVLPRRLLPALGWAQRQEGCFTAEQLYRAIPQGDTPEHVAGKESGCELPSHFQQLVRVLLYNGFLLREEPARKTWGGESAT